MGYTVGSDGKEFVRIAGKDVRGYYKMTRSKSFLSAEEKRERL